MDVNCSFLIVRAANGYLGHDDDIGFGPGQRDQAGFDIDEGGAVGDAVYALFTAAFFVDVGIAGAAAGPARTARAFAHAAGRAAA